MVLPRPPRRRPPAPRPRPGHSRRSSSSARWAFDRPRYAASRTSAWANLHRPPARPRLHEPATSREAIDDSTSPARSGRRPQARRGPPPSITSARELADRPVTGRSGREDDGATRGSRLDVDGARPAGTWRRWSASIAANCSGRACPPPHADPRDDDPAWCDRAGSPRSARFLRRERRRVIVTLAACPLPGRALLERSGRARHRTSTGACRRSTTASTRSSIGDSARARPRVRRSADDRMPAPRAVVGSPTRCRPRSHRPRRGTGRVGPRPRRRPAVRSTANAAPRRPRRRRPTASPLPARPARRPVRT